MEGKCKDKWQRHWRTNQPCGCGSWAESDRRGWRGEAGDGREVLIDRVWQLLISYQPRLWGRALRIRRGLCHEWLLLCYCRWLSLNQCSAEYPRLLLAELTTHTHLQQVAPRRWTLITGWDSQCTLEWSVIVRLVRGWMTHWHHLGWMLMFCFLFFSPQSTGNDFRNTTSGCVYRWNFNQRPFTLIIIFYWHPSYSPWHWNLIFFQFSIIKMIQTFILILQRTSNQFLQAIEILSQQFLFYIPLTKPVLIKMKDIFARKI